MESIIHTPGDNNPITVAAHPVTRVYCSDNGIVCYERKDHEPIELNAISPKRSRINALERCSALLDSVQDALQRNFPISLTGDGLTYNQLKQQTFDACVKSREIEGTLAEQINAKRR